MKRSSETGFETEIAERPLSAGALHHGLSQHGERYLEAAVRTATPAKLRLMLLERACEVSARLAESWRGSQKLSGPNEHSLRLLDLLNELLAGVKAQDAPLSNQVADLYVFLIQHLVAAEEPSDATAIDEIRTILEVEAETWRMVCAQENPGGALGIPTAGSTAESRSGGGVAGINLEV